MPSIPQRLYNEVMMADNFTCVYCGVRTADAQIDHIIPRSLGGPDVLHNLVAACPPCNARKSDHALHEAGMTLFYGRYRLRKGVTPSAKVRPSRGDYADYLGTFSEESRQVLIRAMALELDANGAHVYSANSVYARLGGSRNKVMAYIKQLRSKDDAPAEPPVNTTPIAERPTSAIFVADLPQPPPR